MSSWDVKKEQWGEMGMFGCVAEHYWKRITQPLHPLYTGKIDCSVGLGF